jgi:polar amino acid transport system substrate-binding protein
MTITPERSEAMCISIPYLYNNQVAVVKVADKTKYTSIEEMSDAIIGVESGSAGETVVVKAK